MADDAQAALAAAAAQVADLQAQLSTANTQIQSLTTQVNTLTGQVTTLSSQAATLTQQVTTANSHTAELQAQLDAINAPVEPGITRGPQPWVTHDGNVFPSLHGARVHLTRQKFGVNAKTAEMILAQGA